MNDPGKNEQIEDRAKTLFDESVERLDAATLSRLNQGRHKALETDSLEMFEDLEFYTLLDEVDQETNGNVG